MTIVRWEPFRELCSFQTEMNRLFNTVFDAPAGGNGGTVRRWTPAMDLLETEDHFVLRADLPGLSEDDVNVELEDNVLTVSGERKAEHHERSEGFYRVERAFGAFSRSLTLPKGVDPEAVTAAFDTACSRCDPEARGAQAAQDRIGGRRGAGQRSRALPPEAPRRARHGGLSALPAARVGAVVHHPRPRPGSRARTGTLRRATGRCTRRPSSRSPPRPCQDARGPRGRRPRLRDGAGQHVPSLPLARARSDPAARRSAPLHALGPAGDHRLGRLPGVLHGPRHGGRRDQGPGRARASRAGRSSGSTRTASASAPTSTARRSSSARRPRWPCRPRSARTSRSCSTSACRSTSRASTPCARPSAPTAGSTAA